MTNEELAELERLLEASNSKSMHPEDVASARFRLGKIARDGRLQSLIATAREAEALRAENARLREMLKPQWFYYGDDQSSERCRFSPYEVVDEDFFGWGEYKKEGLHLVHISTAMPGPDIWAVVRVLTEEEKDTRDDDEPWLIEEYDTEEAARAAIEQGEV